MRQYWKVAVPKPINELFTYFTETDEEQNIIGYRVLVPFGRGNRVIPAIVVRQELEFVNKVDVKIIRTKEIAEIIDTQQVFNDNMLKFITWISEYYQAPIGETFKIAIPAGISPKTLIRFFPNREKAEQEIQSVYQSNPIRWKLLSFLLSETNAYSIEYLEHFLDIPNIQYHINHLLERNLITINQTESRISSKFAKAVKINQRLIEDREFLKETLDILDKKASKQASLVTFLLLQIRNNSKILVSPTNQILINDEDTISSKSASSLEMAIPVSEISKVIANPITIIKSLEKKGFVEIIEIEIDRNKQHQKDGRLAIKNEAVLQLTEEQTICVESINKAIEHNSFSTFLINGVTGSGKTLVYIHIIQKALELGKSALVLVPEISLTPQLIDRFNIVFPEQVSVFHSRLSDGERYDAWRAVLSGKSRIALGVRSALFAPMQNLGLIIVDEEHENSYKQQGSVPYYQARDAALMRAKIENIAIVLGSATPSIESFYNAQIGKYKLLEIKHRADNAELPDIQMIDMISARKNGQVIGDFSRALIDKIKDKISRKEGIILFQNKRGFASHLECPDCGYIPHCKHCSVTLTYHQTTDELRCHYCGYTRQTFKTCEICGAVGMKLVGSGTQRIEEQLNDILEQEGVKCDIERLDLDSVRKRGSHRKILQNFNDGKTDILLGTQMVAKGLDFPRVTLVGVINADIQLLLPDFRSAERTFQLLSQVAGRAGRSGHRKGEVIIQTSQSANYAIKAVKNNDYLKFFKKELEFRIDTKFPPFVRYCVVEFAGQSEDLVYKKANEFYNILCRIINSQNFHTFIEFYSPHPPPISKINDRYRVQISVKGIKSTDPQFRFGRLILQEASKIYSQKFATATVNLSIDIDSFSGY